MNKRREPRFTAAQTVLVTVLGDHETQQPGTIRNASPRGLAIDVSTAIIPGAALKIELEDSILLGEAVFCKGGNASYLVGVELDQMLCGLTELGKRLQEFAAEDQSHTEHEHSVNHRPRQNRQQAEKQQ